MCSRWFLLILVLHVVTNTRAFPSSPSPVRCRSLESSALKVKVEDGVRRLGAHQVPLPGSPGQVCLWPVEARDSHSQPPWTAGGCARVPGEEPSRAHSSSPRARAHAGCSRARNRVQSDAEPGSGSSKVEERVLQDCRAAGTPVRPGGLPSFRLGKQGVGELGARGLQGTEVSRK